ncbi:MAG TPA: hypothetical protein VNN73_04705 [Blastocatellia bacterium]|nr:hypothetical protein [Blastocatellia bacterium]
MTAIIMKGCQELSTVIKRSSRQDESAVHPRGVSAELKPAALTRDI